MATTKRWDLQIQIEEHDDTSTRAEARLTTSSGHLTGVGIARRNPQDRNVPEIGDELAAARALSELSHQLLHAAAEDIEGITHEPVRLDA